MRTKISQLREMMGGERWGDALRFAAKFPRLGAHKRAIERGAQAVVRPEWARQMGRSPADDVRAGIVALRDRYGLT